MVLTLAMVQALFLDTNYSQPCNQLQMTGNLGHHHLETFHVNNKIFQPQNMIGEIILPIIVHKTKNVSTKIYRTQKVISVSFLWQCHGSSNYVLASHCKAQDSIPAEFM
jgi:hypothetical protein